MAKVLFQSTNFRMFRTTLIGYLYEIAQKHEVILLTDQLDSYTQHVLDDKSLFPGLQKIVVFESSFGGNILYKNYRLKKIIQKIIQEYRPDIVMAPSDMWPSEMYLLRAAKKVGALTIAIQSGFKIAGQRKMYIWSCLTNAHENIPNFLPLFFRLFLGKMKKYVGYFVYHWILPLTVGEMPFLGKTSFVFWDESAGLRDADYSAVFSKRDYDISIKDGVRAEKLFVIGHPFEHEATKRFFEKIYFSQHQKTGNDKTAVIMWSGESIGFDAKDYSIVPEEKIRKSKIAIVKHISEILADWNIFIKPHPSVKSISEIKEFLRQIPSNISVVNPSDSADTYIEMSSVIVGMPLPSTTLFTAQKQHPNKIILSLNINNEFLGDSYKDFEGIEYIDTEEQFIRVLDAIGDGTYQKKSSSVSNFDFADTAELIDSLYAKRIA